MNTILQVNDTILNTLDSIIYGSPTYNSLNQIIGMRYVEDLFINNNIHRGVGNTTLYKIYKLIRDTIYDNIVLLKSYSPTINPNTMGSIKRNTRYIIEGYINLICILNEPRYEEVYKKECRQEFDNEILNNFLDEYDIKSELIFHEAYNGDKYIKVKAKFNILTKIYEYKQIKSNNLDRIKYFVKKYDMYTYKSHPNIFKIDIINNNQDIKEIININLDIYMKSLKYIIEKFILEEDMNYYMQYLNNTKLTIDEICTFMDKVEQNIIIRKYIHIDNNYYQVSTLNNTQ